MPFIVQQLIEGHQEPVKVSPDSTAQQALELMIEHDFSQLPVVDEKNKPLGIVTADSILRALNNFGVPLTELQISHAIVKVDQSRPDDDLFGLLDDLKNTYAVLIIHNDGTLNSIVTSYDTTEYFRRRAEDIMYVEDIESTIKEFILTAFNSTDNSDQHTLTTAIAEITDADIRKNFQSALKHYLNRIGLDNAKIDQSILEEVFTKHFSSKDSAKSFDDLTLHEYIQLMLHKSKWPPLNSAFKLKREAILNFLSDIREIRNALAHFHGELSSKQRDQLHYCAQWLEHHRSAVVSAFQANTSLAEVQQGTASLQINAILEPSTDEISQIEEEVNPIDSRFAPLAIRLQELPLERDQVQLTFKQIKEIINDELPLAARQHPSWWTKESSNYDPSQQWLDVGWRVSRIDVVEETVIFTRLKERKQAYTDFFTSLLRELQKWKPFPIRTPSPKGKSFLLIAGVPEGGPIIAYLIFSFARDKRFRVELYIDEKVGDKEKNKRVFDALHSHKKEIEAELKETLSWERIDDKRASRIALYRPGSITDQKDDLNKLREWAVSAMIRFQRVMERHINEVVREIL